MFITNDVALLTFVPFACTILQKCHQERLIVTAFVLQTLAANLGEHADADRKSAESISLQHLRCRAG